MHHLIFALFRGPFWSQLACACGLIAQGYTFQSSATQRAAMEAALLQQAPPAAIAIADMTVDHDHRMATEVAVTAQVALDRTTRLLRTTNFITTSEDILYVLVDANASILDDVAYGAIVVDADEADRVSRWLAENATSVGGAGPALTITGPLSGSIRADMVDGALTDRGMVKSPDFFYITPHFDGREAALTPQPFAGFWSAAWVYAIAAFFLALGAFKFALRDRNPQVARTSPHVEAAHSHEAAYQIADRLIDEDIARARIQAAMANPLIAPGGAAPPPKRVVEMFTVPAPVHQADAPLMTDPAIKTSLPLGQGIGLLLREVLTPQRVACIGILVLMAVLSVFMADERSNSFGAHGASGQSDLAWEMLPWLGGLVVVVVLLKGFIWVPQTSRRKGIYDPYLRLAERERADD